MRFVVVLVLGLLPTAAAAQVKYIDTHAHLHGFVGRGQPDDYRGAAQVAIKSMDEYGAARMIVMPPPLSPGMPLALDANELLGATKGFADRFAVVAGGGTLNPMILEAARSGNLSDAVKQRFVERAEQLAKMPIVGYGELTTEHFSLGPNHPYISVPSNHPLLLMLADIAAKHDLPIELHMEAIDVPADLNGKYRSPPNPAKLVPNVPAFEELLAHNRATRIIWSHAGWDNTGQRTPALLRRLFAAHSNLYINTKMAGDSLPVNRIVTPQTGMDPEWRTLIMDFPERILMATDQFHITPASSQRFPNHPAVARTVLDALPADIAHRIGMENPLKVYPRLKR